MRRPLLFCSFCLVAVIALWNCRADASAGGGPPDGTGCVITGRVRQKDETSFTIHIQNIQIQNAAVLRQDYPETQLNNDSMYDMTDFFSDPRERNILCEYERSEELVLGSVVTVQGDFRAFEAAGNPGEFDYARYYWALGYAGRLRNTEFVSQKTCAVGVQEGLYLLRRRWEERLYRIFPEREASVMAAILLGEKAGVDEEVKNLYQRNGIVHILSISGLHISLIGMGIYRLLRRAGVRVGAASVVGGAVLVLYGMMTGMSVSVCRAIGMYLIRMLAQILGRTYDMLTALGVVAVLMALYRPAWLGHMGFLMSFGSVLGVGALLPALTKHENHENREMPGPRRLVEGRWRKRLLRGREFLWNALRQGLLASLSVTLTTLPIQLWFTYEIPTYAILLNVLVLPSMGVLMVAGLAAMLLPGLGVAGIADMAGAGAGMAGAGMAGMAGMVDLAILAGYEKLCGLFERLPWGTWNPGRPEGWQMVVYYLLWAAAVWGVGWHAGAGRARQRTIGKRVSGRRTSGRRLSGRKLSGQRMSGQRLLGQRMSGRTGWPKPESVRFLLLGLAVLVIGFTPRSGDRVTFLDVGQGDGICVQLSSGEVYLFDCGSSSRSHIGERVLIPFLKYYGIRKVDAVFVSHADTDHVNGILELLEQCGGEGIAVSQVVLPGICQDQWQEEFGELLAEVKNASGGEIPVSLIRAGESWSVGEDFFLCLHPSASGRGEGGNAGSACFYIELREGKNQISMLFTGDVEGEGEEELLGELQSREIREVTVLKVAHHGSRNSTSAGLLEQIRPGLSIISCGQNNRYGHPHAETLERLDEVDCKVLRTDRMGAICITLDKEGKVWGMKGVN